MKWKAFLISFLVIGLSAVVADNLKTHTLTLTGVSQTVTNDTVTTALPVNGYIDAVYLSITSGGTATVSIASITNSSPNQTVGKTIVSKSAFDTSAWYEPRAGEETTGLAAITDSSTKLSVAQQFLQLSVNSANTSNINVTAHVTITEKD